MTASTLDGVTCISSLNCLAVGSYTDVTGTFMLAEAWDGTTWRKLATGSSLNEANLVFSGVSCLSATDCLAVGSHGNGSTTQFMLAEAWNGSTWTRQHPLAPPESDNTDLSTTSCSSSTCTATGTYTDKLSGSQEGMAETWNGSTWSEETLPGSGLYNVHMTGLSCTSPTSCIAVGDGTDSEKNAASFAEALTGADWSESAIGSAEGPVTAGGVSCTGTTNCITVGFTSTSADTDITLAEAWDGTDWSTDITPNPVGAIPSQLSGVSCTSPSDCVAVGWGINGEDTSQLAEIWHGSQWRVRALPHPPDGGFRSYLTSVSCTNDQTCMAVGYYQRPDDGSYINVISRPLQRVLERNNLVPH